MHSLLLYDIFSSVERTLTLFVIFLKFVTLNLDNYYDKPLHQLQNMNSIYDNDDYRDFMTNVRNVHTAYITTDQTDSTHVKQMLCKSQIKMKQPNIAKNACEKLVPFGLFKLFYSDTVRDAMWEWTNNHFARTGACKISKIDLDVFIALEMAMGLRKNNNIKDYWSKRSS